jgi:type IV pilus assembly protein PilQ
MVKQFHGVSGLACATALISPLMMVSAAVASPMTQVTDVQLTQKAGGLDVVLQTQGGGKPQVFNVNNKDNSFTSFLFNAKVAKAFRKDNPAPGIAYVSVTPSGSNGVEVKVAGNGAAPTGQVVRKDATGITLSVMGNSAQAGRVGQAMTAQSGAIAQAVNIAQAAAPVAPLSPSPVINSVPPSLPSAPVPPLQPRPVAPPVGDMSVGQIDTSAPSVDLGSAERIPRLVLRDAPVREVLSLLARAAGMNLAFAEAPGAAGGGAPGGPGGGSSGGPTISLDIENESVQDVFNYVLRIACVPAVAGGGGGGGGSQCASLEANRVGRTIFVGPRLPDDARNTVSRTIRLNQAAAANAASFLTTQGAETQRAIEQISLTTVGEGAAARTVETRTPTILALRANEGVGPLVLRGLSVATDDRLNSITLTGTPRKVDMATALLTQLDARRRQATVSVKVVDINLNAINRSGTSFSFGINDTQVVQQGGAAVINLGSNAPSLFNGTVGGATGSGANPNGLFNVGNRWLAQLQATIDSENAKILTDPTLLIQEGQRAQVKLIEEVPTNLKIENQTSGNTTTRSITIEKQEAGLQLDIDVERIDDNGFMSLRVNPKISAPAGNRTFTLDSNVVTITLLQKREVSSGLVRIRDGQTLVLAGVIQESDRAQVSKVPILGDLPLLGALFRRTTNTNERREVVVLLTPRIMDDSDRATYGYGYNPSSDAQKLIQKN